MLARLHAELSRCMYSLHGFDALMRPVFAEVCQRLIVVSNCIPGSAHCHDDSEISRKSVRALTVLIVSPVLTARSAQSRSSSTAVMNSSVTRTELFAFWYWIEWLSAPSRSMSKPASRRARALRSSTALHHTNSSMSGWSTSRITIFAARRVLPPDLIVPAEASAPRMKLTGPDAVPPLDKGSIEPRIFDRLIPEPEPPRKMLPSLVFQARIDSMLSCTLRMKHAEHCGLSSNPTLNQTGELNAAIWRSRM